VLLPLSRLRGLGLTLALDPVLQRAPELIITDAAAAMQALLLAAPSPQLAPCMHMRLQRLTVYAISKRKAISIQQPRVQHALAVLKAVAEQVGQYWEAAAGGAHGDRAAAGGSDGGSSSSVTSSGGLQQRQGVAVHQHQGPSISVSFWRLGRDVLKELRLVGGEWREEAGEGEGS
jgi:hypothetical protein